MTITVNTKDGLTPIIDIQFYDFKIDDKWVYLIPKDDNLRQYMVPLSNISIITLDPI